MHDRALNHSKTNSRVYNFPHGKANLPDVDLLRATRTKKAEAFLTYIIIPGIFHTSNLVIINLSQCDI